MLLSIKHLDDTKHLQLYNFHICILCLCILSKMDSHQSDNFTSNYGHRLNIFHKLHCIMVDQQDNELVPLILYDHKHMKYLNQHKLHKVYIVLNDRICHIYAYHMRVVYHKLLSKDEYCKCHRFSLHYNTLFNIYGHCRFYIYCKLFHTRIHFWQLYHNQLLFLIFRICMFTKLTLHRINIHHYGNFIYNDELYKVAIYHR